MASTANRSASMRPLSTSTCKSPLPVTAWMRLSYRWSSALMSILASLLSMSFGCSSVFLSFGSFGFDLARPRVLVSVEREHDRRLLEIRFDVHGALPELVQVRQRVLGVVRLQLD